MAEDTLTYAEVRWELEALERRIQDIEKQCAAVRDLCMHDETRRENIAASGASRWWCLGCGRCSYVPPKKGE